MSKLVNLFLELGSTIDDSWRVKNYDKKHFPEIAAHALRNARLQDKINFDEIMQIGLNGHHAINFWQDNSPFGDLQIVPYKNNNFYIEILVWQTGSTSIHDHAFSGAFLVLSGHSINGTYDFEVHDTINENFKIGRLNGKLFEILNAGDVREIHAGRQLIHTVYHQQQPTVSIVVRTFQDEAVMPQYEYRGHQLAVNLKPNPELINKIRTFNILSNTNPESFSRNVIEHFNAANLDEKYWLARGLFTDLRQHDLLDKCFNADEKFILAVLEHEEILSSIIRQRKLTSDDNFRLFIDLLINVPTWSAISKIIFEHRAIDSHALFTSIYDTLSNKYGFSFSKPRDYLVESWIKERADFKTSLLDFSNIYAVKNPFKNKILGLG